MEFVLLQLLRQQHHHQQLQVCTVELSIFIPLYLSSASPPSPCDAVTCPPIYCPRPIPPRPKQCCSRCKQGIKCTLYSLLNQAVSCYVMQIAGLFVVAGLFAQTQSFLSENAVVFVL